MTSITAASHQIHTSSTGHTEPYLDDLAHLIAMNGIADFESDIARLVVRLRSVDLGGALIDILADRRVAPIVRERAFGMLVGQLARGPAGTTRVVTPAA